MNELDYYLSYINELRDGVGRLVAGLPADALNWEPLKGADDHTMNSLAVMATHVAGAEHFWISEVIGRAPATRHRPVEFTTRASSADELLARLEAVAVETAAVFAALTPADLDGERPANDRTVAVRWAILHVIEHSALHLGHMQITWQLWSGGAAQQMPRWFERLPPAG
jgi:uncharacterized damage-inducible protein DinB